MIKELWAQGGDWSPWIFLAVLVVVLLILNRIVHWVLSSLAKRAKPENKAWRNAFIRALDAPVRGFIWLSVATLVVRGFFPEGTNQHIDHWLHPCYNVLAILLVSWFFFRSVSRIQENLEVKAKSQGTILDPTAAEGASKLAWAIIFIVMVVSIMQALGVSLAGLLAFGGAAGIAVGFAAQNLVSNLFGGMTIFISKIFKLNEDIIVNGTDLSGTVVQIGWRSTTLVGWNGKRIYVPNALFNTNSLTNHSRLQHRSLSADILVRYENYDKVKAVIEEGNTFLAGRDDLNYFVFRFDGFGDKALKLNLFAWVQSTNDKLFVPYADFAVSKEALLMGLADIAKKHGCEVLPLNRLWLEKGPEV